MKQFFTYSIAIITLFSISCNHNEKKGSLVESKNSAIDLLEGTWYKLPISGDRKFVETWEKSTNQNLIGNAYLLSSKGNTKFNSEQLLLSFENDKWTYTAEPSGQKRTDFTNSILNDSLLRFENLQHDFPQYIQYHFLSNKHLKIEIGNREQTLTWEMEKQ